MCFFRIELNTIFRQPCSDELCFIPNQHGFSDGQVFLIIVIVSQGKNCMELTWFGLVPFDVCASVTCASLTVNKDFRGQTGLGQSTRPESVPSKT